MPFAPEKKMVHFTLYMYHGSTNEWYNVTFISFHAEKAAAFFTQGIVQTMFEQVSREGT